MITREEIPVILEHPVYDVHGSKIGDAKHVFIDSTTGEPQWLSVKTGVFGTRESFVPLHDATMVEDHLEVPFPKDTVRDAPNVDVDAGVRLSEDEEHRLYDHYGIDWDAAWQQANQPGLGVSSDDAMTRSEERMRVGTERREVGRARLRKYVVTEEQEMTVPVRKERVHVEHEPITDENRAAAMAGPEITEAEHEVILHEERPVVETKAEPVERVRISAEESIEEETVKGEVRKERIETEVEGEQPS